MYDEARGRHMVVTEESIFSVLFFDFHILSAANRYNRSCPGVNHLNLLPQLLMKS